MPFPRPTLTALRQRAAADVNAALPGVDALLRFSNMGILADVNAALASGNYGYLDWIAKQCTPFTATDEYLEGWAALKKVTRKPATIATGTASFIATTGAVVPAGTPLTRNDQTAYVSTAEAVAVGGLVLVPFAAVLAGAGGDAPSGVALTLGIGIPGVTSTGSTSAPITGGADMETENDLRTRMLLVYASPPQAGNAADYENWALAVPGVTRAWARQTMGIGTVSVFTMFDDARASEDGFPQGTNGCASSESRDSAATGDQLLVANAIFLDQPLTPLIYSVAPARNGLTITLAGIPNASVTVRAAIASGLKKALLVDAEPGGTTDIILLEGAIAAVSGAAGAVLTSVVATAGTVTPGAAGNIVSDAGSLAVLDGVIYA